MPIPTKLGTLDMRILKFYTKSEVKEDGTIVAHDYVSLCPPGLADKAVSNKRVDKILKAHPGKEMAFAFKQLVEGPYEAWKKGQEVPETGTPLGAWPGLNPDQAEVFRSFGVRTVEEVAEMGERERNRIPLPGMVAIVEMAKRFLQAQSGASVTDALKKKDDEISELREQLQQLASLVKPQEDETKPKRGRPSNAELARREAENAE